MTDQKMKTLPEIMQEIAEQICDRYCKWPDAYCTGSTVGELADQHQRLLDEKCSVCPVRYLCQ